MSDRYLIYGLSRNWTQEDYARLLEAAFTRCNSFVLVNRGHLSPTGNQLLSCLNPFLIESRRSSAWPGTRLLDHKTAEIRKFRLTADSAAALRESVGSLWDWEEPHHPEDLSFLRPSGSPWFISITHERDAFFKLLEGEIDSL